jgi:hypothetical protein
MHEYAWIVCMGMHNRGGGANKKFVGTLSRPERPASLNMYPK